MNNQEAKFILGAYRPDGRDATDVMFAEAMAQAERDPELRAWWERQRTFDATFAAKLQELAPPPGLRDSILAGGRASQPRRHWWSSPMWIAAAAAIVVLVTITFTPGKSVPGPTVLELASFALNDVVDVHGDHTGHPPALAGVQAQLAGVGHPFSTNLKVDLDELRRNSCRSIRVGGREVFEICFERNGTWFHLYAARRDDFAPGVADPRSLLTSRGEFASTAWMDAKNVYAIVTSAGAEALRRVI